MKRCAQCHEKLGLGVRFRNFWNGRWWVHLRFCSAHCEACYEMQRLNHRRRPRLWSRLLVRSLRALIAPPPASKLRHYPGLNLRRSRSRDCRRGRSEQSIRDALSRAPPSWPMVLGHWVTPDRRGERTHKTRDAAAPAGQRVLVWTTQYATLPSVREAACRTVKQGVRWVAHRQGRPSRSFGPDQ
jgi:hypothetical protein